MAVRPLAIFGYGSLVWRPDLPYTEIFDGYIYGWIRRFWQGSPDHRGTPEAPGRVVTLLRGSSSERTWGRLFVSMLTPEEYAQTMSKLLIREQAGYEQAYVQVHCSDGIERTGLVFVATPDNDHFLGEADEGSIADHVYRSVGPSGPNTEYVMRLAEALLEMSKRVGEECVDDHLAAIYERLRALGASL